MDMIKRCTIKDVEQVNRVMRHPSVYPDSIDDGCSPDANTFDAGPLLESAGMYFLGWCVDAAWAGLWMLKPWNSTTYEIHTCILPPYRGQAAIHAAKDAGRWMFENTECRKIVTLVPEDNRPAMAYALAGGMEKEGVIKNSILKDGDLLDQTILGIGKGG